jgi:hypothetical protein
MLVAVTIHRLLIEELAPLTLAAFICLVFCAGALEV